LRELVAICEFRLPPPSNMSAAIGNCVATVVIAAWEGDLDRDRDKAKHVLDGDELVGEAG